MIPSTRQILALTIPMAGEQFLIFGILLFDTGLAGRLGVNELSAQGAVARWIQFTSVAYFVPMVGGSILIAQAVGAWDEQRAADVLGGVLSLGLVSGVGVMLLVLAASPLLVGVLGVEQAVSDLAVPYLRLVALSFPLQFVLMSAGGCVRSAGDARTPLAVMTLANVVHALVAVGLITLTSWRLGALAVATLAGHAVGTLLILARLARGGIRGLSLRRAILRQQVLSQIWHMGSAVGGEQFALRLGQIVNLHLIAPLGTTVLAAYFVVLNGLSIVLLIGLGFAAASLTIVGQQIGAARSDLAYPTTRRILWLAFLIIGAVAAAMFAWPGVLRLFSTDPEAHRLAVTGIRLILLSVGFEIVNQVLTGSIRGAGDTRFPMVITALGQWLIRIPLIMLLVEPFGFNGVWLAMLVEMASRSALNLWRWRTRFWLTPVASEALETS